MTNEDLNKAIDNWNSKSPEERTRIGFGICFQKAKQDFQKARDAAIKKQIVKNLLASTAASSTST